MPKHESGVDPTDEHTSLTSLMIVVAIAFLIPILLVKLRMKFLPVVVAEILAGLIIGKSGLNLITEDPWLELLSTLGLIFLMFLSGLEIDFGQFRFGRRKRKNGGGRRSPHPFAAALLYFAGILAVSYGLGVGLMKLGFVTEPYLMMIIIATISLGVVVPVLKEQRLTETAYGQTILLVTVIADFVTMIIFAVYLSMVSDSAGSTTLILLFFAVIVLVYFVIRRFIRGRLMEGLLRGTSQIGTRGVFALILLFVVLSENMGVEHILGAFLAGVIVSLLAPNNKTFQHQLESFGYGFLIPIFFVMVGVKLNIWELMQDWKVVLFIPVLLIALFISKLVPSVVMRIWYSWKEAWGAGILLTSTLSLVIAAATVALQLGIIDSSIHGALILVAILSCFISPILFNRLVPKHVPKPLKVTVIGANHVTLPVSQDLIREGYVVEIFSSHSPDVQSNGESANNAEVSTASGTNDKGKNGYLLTEVNKLSAESLAEKGAFEADIVVCGSMEEEVNLLIARHARKMGVERVIVRMEDPEGMKRAEDEGFTVFSTLYSARMLLKSLIESPSAVRLMTQHDDSIQEVVVSNPKYSGTMLRDLPLVGKVLVLRIYRGESFIIPHGSTEILAGDRLLVSGTAEHIQDIRRELE